MKVITTSEWIDVTKDVKNVKSGQVLLFNFEGSPLHLKIMRIAKGKIWAKYTHLYTEEELRSSVKK